MSRADLFGGLKQGFVLGAALLALTLPPPSPYRRAAVLAVAPSSLPASAFGLGINGAATVMAGARRVDLDDQSASADVRRLGQWVVNSADNGNRAFAIVDKKEARVFVFAPDGKLRGASAVLLGHAAGDDSVAGIGNRPIADVRPEERTTPAGRFEAEPGRNALGEQVVWVDYDAAVSMHRVRLTHPEERRLARLASPDARDRRISYGCINLPVAFFDDVLWPSLGARRGLVYVLPERKALAAVFPGLATLPGQADAPLPPAAGKS